MASQQLCPRHPHVAVRAHHRHAERRVHSAKAARCSWQTACSRARKRGGTRQRPRVLRHGWQVCVRVCMCMCVRMRVHVCVCVCLCVQVCALSPPLSSCRPLSFCLILACAHAYAFLSPLLIVLQRVFELLQVLNQLASKLSPTTGAQFFLLGSRSQAVVDTMKTFVRDCQ